MPASREPGSDADLIVIGRIGGAYGVGGAVRVTSFTHPAENLLAYRPWLIGDGEAYRETAVVSAGAHGQGFTARLAGITDRDQAQALSGKLVAIPRAALPDVVPGEEYYWRDLVGLSVQDQHGVILGEVSELMATGAHDVMVIRGGPREVLIPFVAPFVLDVDLAARKMRVDWSEPV